MNVSPLFPGAHDVTAVGSGGSARNQPIKLSNASIHLGRPRRWAADLGGHLREQCELLRSSARLSAATELSLTLAGAGFAPSDSVASAGFIVAEAVKNAIKYAHPAGVRGRIEVHCARDADGSIRIDVADDGVGLPEGFDPVGDGGFGFHLMREQSARLGATITFVSTSLGLRVELRAPARAFDIREVANHNGATSSPVDEPANFAEAALGGALAAGQVGDRGFGDLLDALPVAVYTTDAAGLITFYNRAAVTLWGRRPVLGDEWCGSWRLYWPDGQPMAHGECPMAITIKENQPIRGREAIVERPDGERVPFMAYPTPIRDAAGALIGAVNTLVDISERKRAEERQTLMAREIHHRTKNLLAVVQSIVTRGLDGARSVKETRAVVLGRLGALAATYDNLITTSWEGVEFSQIVRRELSPFPGQMEVDGPAVSLNPQSAQNFTLALHELATNAAKYGALSVSTGRVTVRWSVEDANGSPRFNLVWRESGGPPVLPPAHRGFGSMVLDRVITQDFDSPPQVDFAPDGLVYALNVSLSAMVNPGEPHDELGAQGVPAAGGQRTG